ncbi:TetR/AcrR family transcriptional regulator [Nonomuraea jiangxiensis]|uniref:DNA-binding transcriptional regulator, AcrR family n=1 Tax=Nonomuraea jiangxiensis TaxID=633440 RepID=A0A1G9UU11_9ACTN|nr:TetR/AcrR family transcriptional regulator [Nonomuraea jiangxiensis]SDM63411.1 DNA-binding transcriptional regulator, AcrR family [Nonomuraea jiangxiensis]
MPRTRSEQAVWRRGQLLDAALRVFADKGVDGATVKDVAEAAEVTPGLLYRYFDSKEAMVETLLSERGFLPRLRELRTEQNDARPAPEVLTELLKAFDRLLADNAELMAVFFSAAQARGPLAALAGEGQRLIGDFLLERIDAGELRPHDTVTAARTLFATVAVNRRLGTPIDIAALVGLLFPEEG